MDACFSRALAVSGEGNPRVGVLGGPQACSWKPRTRCTVKKAGFPWGVVWWAVAVAGKCRGASWWLSVCHAITNGKQGQGGWWFLCACAPAPLPPTRSYTTSMHLFVSYPMYAIWVVGGEGRGTGGLARAGEPEENERGKRKVRGKKVATTPHSFPKTNDAQAPTTPPPSSCQGPGARKDGLCETG